jgi:transcriptional regulator with XRE-family HTH domain
MARNFDELRAEMSPARRARVRARARSIMSGMLLTELRKLSGRTQKDLAAALGIKQPSLSRIEGQDDMHVSTLRRLVEALGGELVITARMPAGQVTLTQFREPRKQRSA